MLIKEFFKQESRTRSPMDPGKSVITYEWLPTGTNALQDGDTSYFDATGDGWIDVVDLDFAEIMLSRHRVIPGNRAPASWFSEAMAQGEVAGGFMNEKHLEIGPPPPVAAPRGKAKGPKEPAPSRMGGAPTPRNASKQAFSPGASGTKPRRSRDLSKDGAVPNESRGTEDLV